MTPKYMLWFQYTDGKRENTIFQHTNVILMVKHNSSSVMVLCYLKKKKNG